MLSEVLNHIDPPDPARLLTAMPARRKFKRVQKKGRGRMSARVSDLPIAPDAGVVALPPLQDVDNAVGVDDNGDFAVGEQIV